MKNVTGNIEHEEYKPPVFYKLIHVGIPFQSIESDLVVIPCYFQPWLHTTNLPADLPLFVRNVNSNLAGELICGSIWTNSTYAFKNTPQCISSSHVFWSGTNGLFAVLLKNIVNPEALSPSSFWATKGDTWVVCIEFNKKTFIIPYFELLRSLFYQASRRLTYFFLSFLPLKLLCQPLEFLNKNNSSIARFYVACQQLTESEARILGGLLFDPALNNIYDIGQNHWLSAHNIKEVQKKSAGRFSKNILFSADGYELTHDCKQYIWVNSLQIVNSPYNFQELLFHPIKDGKPSLSLINNSFTCSDLLQDGVNYTKLLELHCCSHSTNGNKSRLSSAKKERTEKYLASLDSVLPKVTCMPPWSNLPIAKKKFYWLDRELSTRVQSIDTEPYKNTLRFTPSFNKILTSLKAKGYLVNNVTLNNPQGVFGKGLSVFPVKNYTPLPINAYRGSIKAFTLARIHFTEGPAFLTQPFPEQNPNLVFLCQKQDMSEPTALEWNNLFSIIQPIHNYGDYKTFYKKCAALNRTNVSTNSALIALAIPLKEITVELCISFNDHIISRFRKRLQFYIAAFLKYPKGMNYNQHKELIRLSYNICKAPDSLWISRISNYWSFKQSPI